MKILIALVVSGISLIPLFAEDVGYAGSGPARGLSRGLDPALKDAPYRNPALDIEKRIDDLVGRMTPFEKFKALHCRSTSSAGGIPRIGLSEFLTCDGGVGPRAEERSGITYIPSGIAWAAAWDPALAEEAGRVTGEETRAVFPGWEGGSARMLLGPGGNIGGRTPFGARSFEYLGEDPLLAGRLAGRFAKGLQSVKVSPCMKHYVCNDQEWCRTMINVTVGERALREIYVRPFEIAIREGGVWSIMNSYNAVNGEWTSWNRRVNDILYRDCGWDGALLSDWGGYRNDLRAIAGGTTLDTNCTDDPAQYRREVEDLKAGRISESDLNDQLRRVLRLFFRIGAFDRDTPEEKRLQARCEQSFGGADHAAVARRAAEESLVLLKNDGAFLPLDRTRIRKVAVIGPGADQRYSLASGHKVHQCGGAAAILPIAEPTPLEACVAAFGRGNVVYAPGFRYDVRSGRSTVPPMAERDPVAAAKEADVVLFFGGTDHSYDHEAAGWGVVPNADKPGLDLKGPQAELIARVAAANPNVVVCLNLGAPVSVQPWLASVKAVLVTWYAGQFGAEATLDALLGKVNPSGKLPYTFGRRLEDWPCHRMGEDVYPGRIGEWPAKVNGLSLFAKETYADGIWVGYRGFDRDGIRPEFAFGHGLSYTSFEIASAPARGDGTKAVRVKNVGGRAGRCVVQCYVTKTAPGVEMPAKELVDFASVTLAAGEEKTVAFRPEPEWLRYWDERSGKWAQAPRGVLRIGEASDRLTVQMEL